MRTISNYLLFEDILDNLPEGSSLMQQAVATLTNPLVPVLEDDCGTLLGRTYNSSYDLEGKVELATGVPLNRFRISNLGHTIAVRDMSACATKGGICKTCYDNSLVNLAKSKTTSVGSSVRVPFEYDLQAQSLQIVSGSTTSAFILDLSAEDYDNLIVISNGYILSPSTYSVVEDVLSFTTIPAPASGYLNIVFTIISSNPLLGYMANTFSGGLLGLSPLPSESLPLRASIYASQIPSQFLARMVTEIESYPTITPSYTEYLSKIKDPLEQVLYILYLYAIFDNVE